MEKIFRKSYDHSTKEYEVLRKTYRWDKYTRQISNLPHWRHYRYYKTLESAYDAIRDIRDGFYDKAYYDYPGAHNEERFPHIKPTITIHRYKVSKRDDL